ncbi:MAG: holo-ACP synthase [Proteobacteria bacterium]|nr:holo-ACP synthase [Pseudomonadota bacterium]
MIVGHGVDILEKNRFINLFHKYPSKIIDKFFLYDNVDRTDVSSLSNNFSAKEAFSKALGLGFRYPSYPNSIAIKRNNLGKPLITLRKELHEYMIEKYHNYAIHLTISDTKYLSISSVIIEQI